VLLHSRRVFGKRNHGEIVNALSSSDIGSFFRTTVLVDARISVFSNSAAQCATPLFSASPRLRGEDLLFLVRVDPRSSAVKAFAFPFALLRVSVVKIGFPIT